MSKFLKIKRENQILYKFLVFFYFGLLVAGIFVFAGEYKKIKALDNKDRKTIADTWPKVTIESGSFAKTYPPFRNDESKWYYTWDHNGSKEMHAFFAKGNLENMYGKLTKVETKKAGVTKKEISHTYIENSFGLEAELFGNQIDLNNEKSELAVLELDFFDRVGGPLGYDSWVREKFANKTLILNGNKINFGDDPANSQYANLTAKDADPDNDGFWAPFGGADPDENARKGGGDGKPELEPEGGDGCLGPWVKAIEAGGSVDVEFYGPRPVTITSIEQLQEEFNKQSFGFDPIVKCGSSAAHGYCYPSNPSETRVQQEAIIFGGVADSPVPMNCPGFQIVTKGPQYQLSTNNEFVSFSWKWNIAIPNLRTNTYVWIGNEKGDAEIGVIVTKIHLEGNDGVLFNSDTNSEFQSLAADYVIGSTTYNGIRVTDKSFWKKFIIPEAENGEYIDLTSGKIIVEVVNPWTDPADLPDGDGRLITALAGFDGGQGPDETLKNFNSRCGELEVEEGIITGKVNPVFCEHNFPHAKDSQAGKYYITGNYLDITGDEIVEDMFQDKPAFTNYEEFVWGTDPLNPNSNWNTNEIYTDEMNIAGVAKSQLEVPEEYSLDTDKLNVDVEGITGVPIENLDTDFWIGHVNTDADSSDPTGDLTVNIRPYAKGGPWTTPAVGQIVNFVAEIDNNDEFNNIGRLNFEWTAEVVPEGGTMQNIKEVAKYQKQGVDKFMFEITEPGTYLVRVKVSDRDKRTAFDDYEFVVKAGYTLSYYTAAIQGDAVEVKVTNTQNIAPAAYVWNFEGQKVENNTDTFKFVAFKGSNEIHTVNLKIINKDNSTENLETNIEVLVKDATVNMVPGQGWELVAGSTNEGYYNENEEITVKGIVGPVGSTWDDPTKEFTLSWTATAGDYAGSLGTLEGETVLIGKIETGVAEVTVRAKTEGATGNLQISPPSSLILKKNLVAGVVSGFFGGIRHFWWLILVVLVGIGGGWYYQKRQHKIKKIKFSPI
jgi:hypothetical protein